VKGFDLAGFAAAIEQNAAALETGTYRSGKIPGELAPRSFDTNGTFRAKVHFDFGGHFDGFLANS
jgi:hypothetical protein